VLTGQHASTKGQEFLIWKFGNLPGGSGADLATLNRVGQHLIC
jgi:hypothetical protein